MRLAVLACLLTAGPIALWCACREAVRQTRALLPGSFREDEAS